LNVSVKEESFFAALAIFSRRRMNCKKTGLFNRLFTKFFIYLRSNYPAKPFRGK